MANKIVSRVSLMFDSSVREKANRCKPLPTTYVEMVQTQSLKDGVIHTIIEPKTRNVADRDNGLKYTDFSIDSLQFAGALSNAQFSQFSGDRLGMADDIDFAAAALTGVNNNEVNTNE